MRVLALLVLVACRPATPAPISNRPPPTGKGIALAVVFHGWELLAGNDRVLADKDDPSRYPGVLPALDQELPKLASLGGDSLASLIVYADHATVAHPLAPLAAVGAGWMGTQKSYFGKLGSELIAGLVLAARTLEGAPPSLARVVLLLGDGCDTDQDTAKQRLAALDLAKRGITVHQIQIRTPVSAECGPLPGAVSYGASLIPGIDQFVAALRR